MSGAAGFYGAAVVRLAKAFGVTADRQLAGVGEEPSPEVPPGSPARRKGKKK